MGSGYGDADKLRDAIALAKGFKSYKADDYGGGGQKKGKGGGGQPARESRMANPAPARRGDSHNQRYQQHGQYQQYQNIPQRQPQRQPQQQFQQQPQQMVTGPPSVLQRNYTNAGKFVPSAAPAKPLLGGSGMEFLRREDPKTVSKDYSSFHEESESPSSTAGNTDVASTTDATSVAPSATTSEVTPVVTTMPASIGPLPIARPSASVSTQPMNNATGNENIPHNHPGRGILDSFFALAPKEAFPDADQRR